MQVDDDDDVIPCLELLYAILRWVLLLPLDRMDRVAAGSMAMAVCHIPPQVAAVVSRRCQWGKVAMMMGHIQ